MEDEIVVQPNSSTDKDDANEEPDHQNNAPMVSQEEETNDEEEELHAKNSLEQNDNNAAKTNVLDNIEKEKTKPEVIEGTGSGQSKEDAIDVLPSPEKPKNKERAVSGQTQADAIVVVASPEKTSTKEPPHYPFRLEDLDDVKDYGSIGCGQLISKAYQNAAEREKFAKDNFDLVNTKVHKRKLIWNGKTIVNRAVDWDRPLDLPEVERVPQDTDWPYELHETTDPNYPQMATIFSTRMPDEAYQKYLQITSKKYTDLERKFCFPYIGQKVSWESALTLAPGVWLNDKIIHSILDYFCLVFQECLKKPHHGSFFSSQIF